MMKLTLNYTHYLMIVGALKAWLETNKNFKDTMSKNLSEAVAAEDYPRVQDITAAILATKRHVVLITDTLALMKENDVYFGKRAVEILTPLKLILAGALSVYGTKIYNKIATLDPENYNEAELGVGKMMSPLSKLDRFQWVLRELTEEYVQYRLLCVWVDSL
jgi:hypothetical protein